MVSRPADTLTSLKKVEYSGDSDNTVPRAIRGIQRELAKAYRGKIAEQTRQWLLDHLNQQRTLELNPS